MEVLSSSVEGYRRDDAILLFNLVSHDQQASTPAMCSRCMQSRGKGQLGLTIYSGHWGRSCNALALLITIIPILYYIIIYRH